MGDVAVPINETLQGLISPYGGSIDNLLADSGER